MSNSLTNAVAKRNMGPFPHHRSKIDASKLVSRNSTVHWREVKGPAILGISKTTQSSAQIHEYEDVIFEECILPLLSHFLPTGRSKQK